MGSLELPVFFFKRMENVSTNDGIRIYGRELRKLCRRNTKTEKKLV